MAQPIPFELGQAMARAVRIVRSNILVFSGITAIISVGAFLVQMILIGGRIATLNTAGDTPPSVFTPGLIVLFLILMLVALFVVGFVHALMAHGAECDLEGRKATFSSAWTAGFRHSIPVAVIMILTTIAVFAGAILLIIPAFIIGTFLGLATSAQVIDRTGIFSAFGASIRISKGNRWALFAYFLVSNILLIVALLAVYAIGMGVFGSLLMTGVSGNGQPSFNAGMLLGLVLYFLFILVMSVVTPQLQGVIPAAAYAQFKANSGDRETVSAFD